MRRNKRCLLAYHKVRASKLEGYCWEGVDVLEQQNTKEGDGGLAGKKDESSLSPEEEEYVRQYSDLLAAYKGQWTDIDLTGSLEPPRDLFIDVRVLKDAGEIQTEYGYDSIFPSRPRSGAASPSLPFLYTYPHLTSFPPISCTDLCRLPSISLPESSNIFILPARQEYTSPADHNNSSIILTKNSQFYVRHGDVERLIAQGYLQRLS